MMPTTFHRNAARRIRYAGFSLLEMTITVMIVGLIAAVTIPRYASSLQRYRTKVAVQRLAQDMDLCRRHARFTSRSVTLTISFDRNFYRISPLDSPLKPGTPYEVVLGTGSSYPRIGLVTLTPANPDEVNQAQLEGDMSMFVVLEEATLEIEKQPIAGDLTIVFDRYGVPDQTADIAISCGKSSGVVRLSAEGVVTKS